MSDRDFNDQEFQKERNEYMTYGALVWVGSVLFTCCILGCIGGCIYYCIKQNQNQRTAAMAQHQMAYQPAGGGE